MALLQVTRLQLEAETQLGIFRARVEISNPTLRSFMCLREGEEVHHQVQVSRCSEWPLAPLQLAMNLHSHSAEGNYYTNFHAVLRPIYSTFTTVGPAPYNMHSLGAIACRPSFVSR